MAEPIISVSGLRGVVGETLTPDVAIRYAAAFAAMAPAGRDRRRPRQPAVGQDARGGHSGRTRRPSAATTIDAGIVATPTAGVLVRHCQRGRRNPDHRQP